MTTAGPLTSRTKQELANLARKRGVAGYQTMSKDELVRALDRAPAKTAKTASKVTHPKPAVKSRPVAKSATRPAAKVTRPAKPAARPAFPARPTPAARPLPAPVAKAPAPSAAKASAVPTIKAPAAKIPPAKAPPAKPTPLANGTHVNGAAKTVKPATLAKPAVPAPAAKAAPAAGPPPVPGKSLAGGSSAPGGFTKDRILLMVPDAHWLHAYWELTAQSVQRAEAALRQDWHGARPTIRLFDVTSQDTTSTSETPVRDVQIHGLCNNWYIDVPQPPRQYRADIGYVSRRGDFFVLARSNVVTPPKAGATEALDVGWADLDNKKAERVLAMSTGFESPEGDAELRRYLEEKLRRPFGGPKDTGFGTGAVPPASIKKFFFELDAKLVVFGKTDPSAHVTLGNEPIQLGPDGTFFMSLSLPDSRQIIPAVASSADGVEERTIVLAVERNTKHLDPMIHDPMNDT